MQVAEEYEMNSHIGPDIFVLHGPTQDVNIPWAHNPV